MQNFASKVATGRGRKYDHAIPLTVELGWLKTEETRGTALVERKPPTTVVSNPATFNFRTEFLRSKYFSEFDILVDFHLHL